MPVIILYALLVIVSNSSRPFISNRFTSNIFIKDNRYKKYFANRPELYEEYKATLENVNEMNYKNIGLILGVDEWEYPLFCQFYGRKINPIHINVSNITKDIPINFKNISCIISTTLNDTVIGFNGKRFYNLNLKNNNIWLYK